MKEQRTLTAFILAGGKSLRFGSDKARAIVAGEPMISRQASVLGGLGMKAVVVAEIAGKYADLGLETIADERPGLGPIGGLATALDKIGKQDWALVTSCDLVELKVEWVQKLLTGKKDDARIVAFHDERWQPLPGLYRGEIREVALQQIDQGKLALWRLIEATASGVVKAELPKDWTGQVGINTKDET